MFVLKTEPFTNIQTIKDIAFPDDLKFRALLITGPPGSGKSSFARKLGGWSEEGYVDLSMNKWWTAQSLSLRPREIHLGFPFKGVDEALAVFEDQYLAANPALEIEFDRISIPPMKQRFWTVNWTKRYAFEFILPPAQTILEWRKKRATKGTHHVDEHLALEDIQRQLHTYHLAAQYLHQQGLYIYVRETHQGSPLRIIS